MYFWARPKAPWETKEVVVPSGRKPPPRDNTGSAPPWERSEDLNITAAAKRPPNVAPFFTELTRHDQPDISGLSVKKNRKPPEPPRWARTSDNTHEIRTYKNPIVGPPATARSAAAAGAKEVQEPMSRTRPPWEDTANEMRVVRGKARAHNPSGREGVQTAPSKNQPSVVAQLLSLECETEKNQLTHQRQLMKKKLLASEHAKANRTHQLQNRSYLLRAEAGRQRRVEASADYDIISATQQQTVPLTNAHASHFRAFIHGNAANRQMVTAPIRYKQLQGGCYPPTGAGPSRKALPHEDLALEHIHGYKGVSCHSNIQFNRAGELVYFAAAVGIVQQLSNHQQRFFYGHTDDISALAVHPDGVTIATGQIGRDPLVCVWDSRTMQLRMRMPVFHEVAVIALAFSPDGARILSAGGDSNHTFGLFELGGSGRLLAQAKGAAEDVLCVSFNGYIDIPKSQDEIVSCGRKHCRFWAVTDVDGFSKSDGIVNDVGEDQHNLSLAILPCGTPVTGTESGAVYQWAANDGIQGTGNKLLSVLRAHEGAVNALCTTANSGFASGGEDGSIAWWLPDDSDQNVGNVWPAIPTLVQNFIRIGILHLSSVLPLSAHARALSFCAQTSTLAIGTSTNDILVVGLEPATQAQASIRTLVQGHFSAVYAITQHPTLSIFASAADDLTIRLWSLEPHSCIAGKSMRTSARALAFSPDARWLAVGLVNGTVQIIDAARGPDGFALQAVAELTERAVPVHALRFSPDGKHLAVASRAKCVDMYAVEISSGQCRQVAAMAGHSGRVLSVDFTDDSSHLMTTSSAGELLYWDVRKRKQATDGGIALRDARWATWGATLGWPVMGIFPAGADVGVINTLCISPDRRVIALGDRNNLVRLLRCPATEPHAPSKVYTGHSSHVTAVCFVDDGHFLVSAGGRDQSLFVWSISS